MRRPNQKAEFDHKAENKGSVISAQYINIFICYKRHLVYHDVLIEALNHVRHTAQIRTRPRATQQGRVKCRLVPFQRSNSGEKADTHKKNVSGFHMVGFQIPTVVFLGGIKSTQRRSLRLPEPFPPKRRADLGTHKVLLITPTLRNIYFIKHFGITDSKW